MEILPLMMEILHVEFGSVCLIVTCLLLSAFFSAAETSITSLGTLKAKHLLSVKGKKASAIRLWINHPERVIATILLFNNIVNILASSILTQISLRYFENKAIGIATGLSTFLVLVFGEIVPKSFAKAHSTPIALISMRIIHVIYFISYPIIRSLSGFAELVVRTFTKKHGLSPLITEEELEFMVNEGGKAGILEEMKKEIIEGAFDFDETTVREIMTPRTHLKALELNTSFHQVLDMVIKTGHSRIPVYRQHIDHIVGVILAKDLLNFMVTKKDIETIKASDLMRECVLVPETNSIRDAFKDLQRSKNHIGIIIDEYGGTAGVVTMEDILEEFFGEIQDEFDVDENKIVKKDDGLYEVNGTVSLEEFLKYFGITKADLSEENLEQEVETVAGLITFYVGQIPKKGQSITLGSYKLTVTDVEKRHIKLVNVESLRKKEKPDLKFFHGKKTKR